jgi:hypothetical protein
MFRSISFDCAGKTETIEFFRKKYEGSEIFQRWEQKPTIIYGKILWAIQGSIYLSAILIQG